MIRRFWKRLGIEQASDTRRPAGPAPAECPTCRAPLEHNRELGYVTCSMLGLRHFWRWVS